MSFLYYQDIRLFPDAELGTREIGATLFNLLHQGFVKNKNEKGESKYALSFPEYSKGGTGSLGRIFRVFAYTKESLEELDIINICKKISGYVECSEIALVPKTSTYLRFYRIQKKTNKERLIRRTIRRKNLSIIEASDLYKDFSPQRLKPYPHLYIKSSSTKQVFAIAINCKVETNSNPHGFSMYGLSTGGNIPDF